MSRPAAAVEQVLTANDLLTGDVVYRDASGGWTRRVDAARRFATAEAAADALAAAAAEVGLVVAPYLTAGDHLRDRIRASGPTVRPDLTKSSDA